MTAPKPGWQRLAKMLAGMTDADATAMINQIREDDTELAQWLDTQRISLARIIALSTPQLALLVAAIDESDLLLILRGLKAVERDRLFSAVSQRKAAVLRDDLAVMPAVRKTEIDAAEQRLLKVAQALEAEGKLSFSSEALIG